MSASEFAGKIYISPGIINLSKVKAMLERKVALYDVYLVCIYPAGKFNMEILSCNEILKEIHSGRKYIVIGVADGRKEAFELVREIIEDFVKEGQEFSMLKQYIIERIVNG